MTNITSYSEMWQAVLYRVVQDLTNDSNHAFEDFRTAQRWVGDYPSKDFREVCTLAGIEPDFLHPKLLRMGRATEAKHKSKARKRAIAAE